MSKLTFQGLCVSVVIPHATLSLFFNLPTLTATRPPVGILRGAARRREYLNFV